MTNASSQAAPPIPTILVTGFLGSGKTTFLNALAPRLSQMGLRVAALVNEVGDIALDAVLVHDNYVEQVVEVTRGSIFCACVRGDLVAAMRQLAEKTRPDVLIVEATGVADPGELGGFSDHPDVTSLYRLTCSVCLAAANRLYKVAQTLAAVRRQLAVADMVIVTGGDIASAQELERTLAAIKEHGSQAAVEIAPFANLSESAWEKLLAALIGEGRSGMAVPTLSEAEPLERARDIYSSKLVKMGPVPDAATPESLAALLPPGAERAKGFVQVGGELKLFQYRGGVASLAAAPPGAVHTGWVLAIGRFPRPVAFGPLPQQGLAPKPPRC